MLDKILKVSIGTTSVTTIQAVDGVELPTSVEVESISKLLLQLIVAIATVVQLFRNKEPKTVK